MSTLDVQAQWLEPCQASLLAACSNNQAVTKRSTVVQTVQAKNQLQQQVVVAEQSLRCAATHTKSRAVALLLNSQCKQQPDNVCLQESSKKNRRNQLQVAQETLSGAATGDRQRE